MRPKRDREGSRNMAQGGLDGGKSAAGFALDHSHVWRKIFAGLCVALCRGKAMEQVGILHEQAAVLRALARSFDIQEIRDQLLELATRCEELAGRMEQNPQAVGSNLPGAPPPDLH